jgi:hypothetical protein
MAGASEVVERKPSGAAQLRRCLPGILGLSRFAQTIPKPKNVRERISAGYPSPEGLFDIVIALFDHQA